MAASLTRPSKSTGWRPDAATIEDANVTRLMRRHGIASLEELHRASLDPEWFWPAVIEDLDLCFDSPFETVADTSNGPAWTEWFPGSTLNIATSCLTRWAESQPNRPAMSWETETGDRRTLSYAELAKLADGVAAALDTLGVEPGDTVGVYMPMAPECAATLYGCWKIGAIAVPIFSGFGPDAIARRLEDAGAKLLVTADGFVRRGSQVAMKEAADAAIEQAPEVEKVLVWRRLGEREIEIEMVEGRDYEWDALVPAVAPRRADSLPADHPALLIYTSGSTGKPKGAVLTHAGLLMTIAKDAAYHVDLKPEDRLCWVTDIGWIMGTWEIVAAGALGASVCLIEGAPATPPDRLWQIVDREGISVLGVSPSLIRGLASAGAAPGPEHDLITLRILGATGEPWSPTAYEWLMSEVGGGRCPVINISGGSEAGCILAPTPIQKLDSCSLGGPALGVDAAVFDEEGRAVGPGIVGELVCRSPWPGMTRSLWNDDKRFVATYWSRFPDTWVHGDWASYGEDGQWFLHGRSDDTLNIGGQRVGPAEAEAALTASDDVSDAAAVAVPHPTKGQAMWCFVVPAPGAYPDRAMLSDAVTAALGKPFRPERVFITDDLPRTRSQKILRRVVRAIADGSDTGDLSSLENPGALEAVRAAIGR